MFADVILPLPLSDLYTYAVPAEMRNKIARGSRVIVPFGNKRYYTAIIYKIEDTISKELKDIDIKEIHSLLNSQPLVNEQQLDRKSTRLNSSHVRISYAVFCLKKKKKK